MAKPGRKPRDPELQKLLGDPRKKGRKQLDAEIKAKQDAEARALLMAPPPVPARAVSTLPGAVDARTKALLPEAPDFLIAEAIELWDQQIPDLVRSGRVRARDSMLLGLYFQELGWALHYSRLAATQPPMFEQAGNRRVKRNNPYRQQVMHHTAEALTLGRSLGVLPSSKQRSGDDLPPDFGVEEEKAQEHNVSTPRESRTLKALRRGSQTAP